MHSNYFYVSLRRNTYFCFCNTLYFFFARRYNQFNIFKFISVSYKNFALAGIYDTWKNPKNNEEIISSAIITTIPNEMMKPIHDRMPVILEPEDWSLWLDKDIKESEVLTPLLLPFNYEGMDAYEVSTFVNSPANNSEQCIQPPKNELF